MSSTENQEFGNLDSNILQVSDTEDKGLDYDKIVERYDEGDLDLIQYAGDASKKSDLDPEAYIEQLDQTYQTLDRLGGDLDVDVAVLPGNHAPIAGAHAPDGEVLDEEFVGQVEEILDGEHERFREFDGNAYKFLTEEKYDNLVNIESDILELENLTVVGGSHHIEEETEREFLEEEPGLEDVNYDGEEVASEITVKRPYNGFLSSIPIVGGVFRSLFSVEKSPNPDELSLDDLPKGFDRTQEHIDYEAAMEMMEGLGSRIENAENNIYLAHHGVMSSAVNRFGSTVVDKVVEEYQQDIALTGGGHTGEPMVDEIYDTTVANTNNGAAIEIGILDGETVHAESYDPTIDGIDSGQQQSEGEDIESNMEQLAQQLADEQVPEQAVTQLMEEEDIERDEALNQAKRIMVGRMQQNQQSAAT
ncbi:MAG: hypothetical protein R6V35_00255 [Candidatus Nanohaloarchaea archaeon]